MLDLSGLLASFALLGLFFVMFAWAGWVRHRAGRAARPRPRGLPSPSRDAMYDRWLDD